MGLFNSNLINTLSKCKNPWKAIGFSALGAFATAAVTYGVKTGWNYVTSLFQTKAAKDVEDYKAEKAQQTETEKAKEARATKEAQAQAQADANDLLNKSLTELVLQNKMLEKWDGAVPKVSGNDSSLLLDITGAAGTAQTPQADNPAAE